MPDPEFIISDGISGGRTWATYRRRSSGSLQRVKSPALPLRETREEAERDLLCWLARRPGRAGHRVCCDWCIYCRHRRSGYGQCELRPEGSQTIWLTTLRRCDAYKGLPGLEA